MSFVSYAQNYEDVMLWRALKHVENGFYIDVGANDPHIDSVTKAFYERGWHGINVEPLSQHHHDLMIARPNDTNLLCAAGSENGQIEIWECDVRGWATASTEVVNDHKLDGHDGVFHKVPMATLRDICAQYVVGEIHFLKVDVEGFEKQVIQGMDLKKYRPWILVIEATKPNSKDEIHQEWEPLLISNDYILAYADGLNRFYVSQEKASNLLQALQYPPNVFDDYIRGQQHDSELRAQQAQTAAQQALEDAQALQTQAEQLHQQLAHAHTQEQQTKEQLQQAMSLAQSAQTRTDQLHQQLAHAQTQEQQTKEQLQQALSLAQTAQAQADQLHQQLAHAHAQEQQTKEQLQQALSLALAMQSQGIEQAQQLQQLHQQALSKHNAEALAQLAQVQAELDQVHQSNHHHWSGLQKAQQELHNTHQANHHHWLQTQELQAQVVELQNSWSWTLSAPLRWAGGLLLRPIASARALANRILGWGINTFQAPLAKSMAWVMTHKGVSETINRWLQRLPHLHAHLVAIGRKQGVLQLTVTNAALSRTPQTTDTENAPEALDLAHQLAQLTPRARQIYLDLSQAIDTQKGKV